MLREKPASRHQRREVASAARGAPGLVVNGTSSSLTRSMEPATPASTAGNARHPGNQRPHRRPVLMQAHRPRMHSRRYPKAKLATGESAISASLPATGVDAARRLDDSAPMSYTLYGDLCSGSATVELALAEIGARYQVQDLSLKAGAQRDDAYQAINPQRKLPTLLTPEGETLTESAAILLTLSERHPEAGLLPAPGSAARARALRWLLFVATELYPIVEIIDYPERFAADANAAPQTRDTARKIWRERWLIVEHNIAGEPWLLAEGFSLTDIYIAVVSRWGQQQDWRPTHVPKVERLTTAVATRPKCAPVWQRHRPS